MDRSKLGIMQGRLSPMRMDRIQSFPVINWQNEFNVAAEIGFRNIELTVDHFSYDLHPINLPSEHSNLLKISEANNVGFSSVTCDHVMQTPFWKVSSKVSETLMEEFQAFLENCYALGIHTIVVPVVDNSKIETSHQLEKIVKGFSSYENLLNENKQRIAFEIDFDPKKTKEFISHFSRSNYGINYDTGNSASLGYDHNEELSAYADRIINVHIKDRTRNGPTTDLGFGDADIREIVQLLSNSYGYKGNFIIQGARLKNIDEKFVAKKYFDYVTEAC